MAELIIKSAFHLTLDVKEIEEKYLPSFMCAVSLHIPHPTGLISYTASDIWFEASIFSVFQKQIKSVSSKNVGFAKLSSMSDEFSIVIHRNKAELVVKEIFPNDTLSNFEFTVPIDRDQLSVISNEFEAFPTWW